MADEPTGEETPETEPTAEVESATPEAEVEAAPAAKDDSIAVGDADAPAEDAASPKAEVGPKAKATAKKDSAAASAEAPAEKASGGAKATPSQTPPTTVRAHAKYVRTSARKARLVCDHIRGKDVQEARAILAHAQRAVARDWSKLLESAVANAEHNHELVGEDLKILSVTADEGPTIKRFRPRAMGRASQIRKRTSHLTITLTSKD